MTSPAVVGRLFADGTGDVDDVAGDAVVGEVLLRREMALGPFAGGRIGTDD